MNRKIRFQDKINNKTKKIIFSKFLIIRNEIKDSQRVLFETQEKLQMKIMI